MTMLAAPPTVPLHWPDGARIYTRTLGFAAVFSSGPTIRDGRWHRHPKFHDALLRTGTGEIAFSGDDSRLLVGRQSPTTDGAHAVAIAQEVFGGARMLSIRAAPLEVAVPLSGSISVALRTYAFRCLRLPIPCVAYTRFVTCDLETRISASRAVAFRPVQLWLETSLVWGPRRPHYTGDLSRLAAIPAGGECQLVAAMVNELLSVQTLPGTLAVDPTFASQRRLVGRVRQDAAGVAADITYPWLGQPLRFTVRNGVPLAWGA